MKESNKRIISGLVFGGLFISSLYTHVSFALLTFIFGIISTNEFNKLTKQKGIGYYIVFSIIYIYFALTEYLLNINNQPNSWFNDLKDTLLIFSIFVSLFLLRDLFSTKNLISVLIKKYFRFSPHKTVEGFLGGLLFCCISASIVSRYVDDSISTSNWLTMAIIVSVFGTLGDLIESKFKRESNVKDSGKIMPGHGGILDRLDSIIFASPYIYLFLKLI